MAIPAVQPVESAGTQHTRQGPRDRTIWLCIEVPVYSSGPPLSMWPAMIAVLGPANWLTLTLMTSTYRSLINEAAAGWCLWRNLESGYVLQVTMIIGTALQLGNYILFKEGALGGWREWERERERERERESSNNINIHNYMHSLSSFILPLVKITHLLWTLLSWILRWPFQWLAFFRKYQTDDHKVKILWNIKGK